MVVAAMIDADRESLEGDGERFSVGRQEIVNSWRRSQSCGVNPDAVSMVAGEVSLETKIARVAIPVLGQMADVLRGGRTSLLLSAPDGTMLWRWSDDSRLNTLLDRRSAVVGTRWNEEIVGTNGLGTALETTRPIFIRGDEHYCEALHGFTCAGAPIRHPITGRVAGVLSVTTLVEDTSPLMAPTLIKLAREVEEQLYAGSTLRERELLHHFLAEQHGDGNAILAINEDVVIANRAAARLAVRSSRAVGTSRGRDARRRRGRARTLRRRRCRSTAADRARGLDRRARDRRRAGAAGTRARVDQAPHGRRCCRRRDAHATVA